MSVNWCWIGRVTQSSFRVIGEVTAGSSRLVVSRNSDLSEPVYFGPVDPVELGSRKVLTLDATDLLPETEYHFAIEDDGVVDANWQGKAPKTAGRFGVPESFSFWSSSCAGNDNAQSSTENNVSNRGSFDDISSRNTDFGIHLGDLHYRDPTSTDKEVHRACISDVLTFNGLGHEAKQGSLYRKCPIIYCTDDHDFGPNDSDTTSSGRQQFQEVYRELVPHYDLPSVGPSSTTHAGGVWHSFVRGRVRFIVSDTRTERSPKSATDNASKIVFGQQQEDWFIDQLQLAKQRGEVVCWVNSYPWIAAVSAGADHWGGYSNYRGKLVTIINNASMEDKMFIVAGDMHALAIDDGRNNQWGGFPVFQFASMDATGSSKGGPYWKGPNQGRDRYGIVDITDQGNKVIVRGTGWIADSEWDHYEFEIPMQVPCRGANGPVFPLTLGPVGWQGTQVRSLQVTA